MTEKIELFLDKLNLIPAPNGWMSKNDPGEPGLNAPRWSINETEGLILAELTKGYDVLEIGTGLGISTCYLYSMAKAVTTVDIDPWVIENVFPLLPNKIYRLSVFPNFSKAIRPFDAVFIDGLHSYQAVLSDIERSRKVLKNGGLFIFHDYKIDLVRYAINKSGLIPIEINTQAGMAIAWNN